MTKLVLKFHIVRNEDYIGGGICWWCE